MGRRSILKWLVPALADDKLSDDERSRLRKFTLLATMILVVCVVSLLAQLTQRSWLSVATTSLVVLVALASLIAVRFRVNLGIVTTCFIGFGVSIAAVMGMAAGAEGFTSIFWISAAPLVAMAVGGRKAGFVTLALSVLAIAVAHSGIEHHWFELARMKEHTFGTKLVSMLGVVVTLFFLVRTYDNETQASIRRLTEQNRQLEEARAEAERANAAKSNFLATISHEIRTPLHGVTGMVALLTDEKDPKRVKDGLGIMQQSADTLLAVINDVLDFSKIESNRLELESVAFAPRAELQLVVNLLQPRAAEIHTDVELMVAPTVPPWLKGDPTRFRQIALNLVSNAVKFSAGGLVSCRLDVYGSELVLEIIDNGIGMSSEVVSKLFTPFSQADASTTRRFGGTGLGLVIAQRLVQAMKGSIQVDSQLGVGSCFVVRMPFEETQAPASQVVPAPRQAGPCRVLVVEDNPVNQLVVKRLLESLGHGRRWAQRARGE